MSVSFRDALPGNHGAHNASLTAGVFVYFLPKVVVVVHRHKGKTLLVGFGEDFYREHLQSR
jgi:hypothetical protein